MLSVPQKCGPQGELLGVVQPLGVGPSGRLLGHWGTLLLKRIVGPQPVLSFFYFLVHDVNSFVLPCTFLQLSFWQPPTQAKSDEATLLWTGTSKLWTKIKLLFVWVNYLSYFLIVMEHWLRYLLRANHCSDFTAQETTVQVLHKLPKSTEQRDTGIELVCLAPEPCPPLLSHSYSEKPKFLRPVWHSHPSLLSPS
jgi:hypothetical protein